MKRYPLRIDRAERPAFRVDTIRNPYDDTPVGEIAIADADAMDKAIAAAAAGFHTMRSLPSHARASILERTAARVRQEASRLAELIAREGGKPITQARAEVERAVVTFTLAAGETRRFGGDVLPLDLEPRGEGLLGLAVRVPRGPVAAISPFNYPLNLVAHKLAPAIAVGTSVVLKPPPQCPLTACELADILADTGLPDDGLQVVPCDPEVAQRMVEDERLKVLSFTGSDTVGWRLKSLAGKKQVLLELGGNAPCILDEGIDLDAVLKGIVAASWGHGGQVCIKVQRILVHASLHDAFLERFIAATRALPCGDPLDPNTVVGPLIQKHHVERVKEWIREAVDAGAQLHCGGEAEGSVVRPAVLTDVRRDMRVVRDEVFGPVTVVERFRDFDEAIALANDTRFGLQAGVYTRDLGRALRAFRELDYGGVLINEVPTFRVDNFPYGGTKDSGFGREGVAYAMEEMTEPRMLVMREIGG